MKRSICAILSLLVAFVICSCTSTPKYQGERLELKEYPYDSKEIKPLFYVTYTPAYAYRPFFQNKTTAIQPEKTKTTKKKDVKIVVQDVMDVRAMRDHGGIWSDEAMRYDLEQITACGFKGVLLRVRPDDMIDDIRLDRIKHFFHIAKQVSPALPVGLLVYSDTHVEMGTGNFAQFLSESGFCALPSQLSLNPTAEDKKLLVIFDGESITLNLQGYREEESFDIRKLKNGKEIEGDKDFRLIKAGDCGPFASLLLESQMQWPVPRGDGSFLTQSLREAFKDKIKVIMIHSWNGFKDASFIVDNNYDQRLMTDVIKREIDALAALPMPEKTSEDEND